MDAQIRLSKPPLDGSEYDLIAQVITSGHLVDGPMTRRFERLVADLAGASEAVACTSATTGLEMCLRALGVGPGDEVVIPDFTHPATGLVVLAVGATPVIVDVDPTTFNCDAGFIADGLSKRTKAVIPVSWAGQPLQIGPILSLCRPMGIAVVEDAACSLGSALNGEPTGKAADASVFSFHPRKVFATGDGGCVVTNDPALASNLRSMKAFGVETQGGRARFAHLGSNYRFSSLLAAVGVSQLRRAAEILDSRIKKAEFYRQALANTKLIRLPFVQPGARHTFQSFCVFVEQGALRDELIRLLRAAGIEAQIGTFAIHREPVFREAIRIGDLRNSSDLADNLLTLPLHDGLTDADQLRVCEELQKQLTMLGRM